MGSSSATCSPRSSSVKHPGKTKRELRSRTPQSRSQNEANLQFRVSTLQTYHSSIATNPFAGILTPPLLIDLDAVDHIIATTVRVLGNDPAR